jgi:thiol:disulfide interchange protein DsbD
VLAVALFLFALNLLGVFEFSVSVTGLNAGEDNSGYGGSFFSGVLAVIVATPCTAPFMGAALGFALTQSTLVSLLVFTALGLGLAAPFLLLAFVPGLAKVLPRPGDWMVTLKQFMGFLMLATVLWLVWLFGKQTEINAVAVLLAAFLLAGIAAWVLGRWNQPTLGNGVRWSARVSAVILLGLALLVGFVANARIVLGDDMVISIQPPTGTETGSGGHRAAAGASDPDAVLAELADIRATTPDRAYWAEWSPELVAGLRERGVPIFVDFTADWCLSCKVNERVALNSPRIWKAIHAAGIVPVKADWTNENEVIGRAIADYGRSGIPLYVLYDRDGSSRFLPEVLTEGIVLDAVNALR